MVIMSKWRMSTLHPLHRAADLPVIHVRRISANNAVPNSKHNSLSSVLVPRLLQYSMHVRLDRTLADVKNMGYLFIAQPICHLLQNFQFPIGKGVDKADAHPALHCRQHRSRHRRRRCRDERRGERRLQRMRSR